MNVVNYTSEQKVSLYGVTLVISGRKCSRRVRNLHVWLFSTRLRALSVLCCVGCCLKGDTGMGHGSIFVPLPAPRLCRWFCLQRVWLVVLNFTLMIWRILMYFFHRFKHQKDPILNSYGVCHPDVQSSKQIAVTGQRQLSRLSNECTAWWDSRLKA